MPTAKRHRILTNAVAYPDANGVEVIAVPGQVVDNLPRQSVPWLEEQGYVERTTAAVGPPPEDWSYTPEPSDDNAIPEDSTVEGEAV